MADPVPFAEFYEAVGRAQTAWVRVEDALRDLFTRLVVCSIHGTMLTAGPQSAWILGSVFYSSTNLRARLKMVTDVIERLVTDADLRSEWNALRNKVNVSYKRRNVLAHGAVWGNSAGASPIQGSMFDSDRSSLTYERVCQCTPSFERLAARIEELAIAVDTHLVGIPGN